VLKTDRVRYTEKVVSAYSVPELEALFAAADQDEYDLFQCFLCTGCRIDLNTKDLLPVFGESHLKAKVTDRGHDSETVHEASEECRTIVTENEANFIRYMLEHQKRDSGKTCTDGWGLLVVPSSGIARQRLLPKIKNGAVVTVKITNR
jgi:hypothetical protein